MTISETKNRFVFIIKYDENNSVKITRKEYTLNEFLLLFGDKVSYYKELK